MDIGLIVVGLGVIIHFASNILFRKGKLKGLKELLFVKLVGLVVTAIGVIVLFMTT